MCVWTEKCGPCVFVWTKIQLCVCVCARKKAKDR